MRTCYTHLSLSSILIIAAYFNHDTYGFTMPCLSSKRTKLLSTSLHVGTVIPAPTEERTGQKNVELMESNTKYLANDEPPNLAVISRMLPPEVFEVDTGTSLFYFGIDLIAVFGSLGFLNAVVTSTLYRSLPFWGQALTVAPLQLLAGFAMWCMW